MGLMGLWAKGAKGGKGARTVSVFYTLPLTFYLRIF